MKKWIVATVMAVAVMLVPAALHVATLTVHAESAAQKQDPQTITVFITRTGAKYHRAECRYLSRSKIAVALTEAAKHYGPCSVCRPPVLR
jgi:cell division protein FtsX